MRMETKEMNFKGFKMNGFLALFLFLFMWAGATVWCFVAGGVLLYGCGASWRAACCSMRWGR